MPLYLVETVSVFRHRYMVECRSAEHACDTVVCGEAGEFSQAHIDESITGCREITLEEYDRLNTAEVQNADVVRDSGSPWMGRKLIHKVVYDSGD